MQSGSSSARDRKHKCHSEQHVRERKSNAQKQFAYNKLKNEKHLTLKHENHKTSTAPKRPPQPKFVNFEKKDKEGMLIDLSSPQQQENVSPMTSNSVFDGCFVSKINNMSILDAPIDVPTQEYPDEELNRAGIFDSENGKPEPPPYQSPPTYMNTYGMTKPLPKYNSTSNALLNQYGSIDPFDTSHISASNFQSVASTQSYPVERNSSSMTRQTQSLDYNDLEYLARPKASATSEIDEIAQKKMVSLSSQIDQAQTLTSDATATAATTTTIQNNNVSSFQASENSQLNDSLKVNLSSLTLDDTDDFELQTMLSLDSEYSNQNPRLNRTFLMELEKEIYKATPNINVNSTHKIHKNDFATSSDMTAQVIQQKQVTAAQSPVKCIKNAIKITNSESASVNSSNSNAICSPSLNQISPNSVEVSSSNQPTYSNYSR